jgi:hypothetical protein
MKKYKNLSYLVLFYLQGTLYCILQESGLNCEHKISENRRVKKRFHSFFFYLKVIASSAALTLSFHRNKKYHNCLHFVIKLLIHV